MATFHLMAFNGDNSQAMYIDPEEFGRTIAALISTSGSPSALGEYTKDRLRRFGIEYIASSMHPITKVSYRQMEDKSFRFDDMRDVVPDDEGE